MTEFDEAIEYLTHLSKRASIRNCAKIGTAIAALRAQQERENPKPLTLDELRQMGKTDWVWVVDLKDARPENNIWERATKIVNMYDLFLYGSAFVAYRHKPKGGDGI